MVTGGLMLVWSLLDTGTGTLKPLARFEPLGQCVDQRPTLAFSVAAFEVVAYVGGSRHSPSC